MAYIVLVAFKKNIEVHPRKHPSIITIMQYFRKLAGQINGGGRPEDVLHMDFHRCRGSEGKAAAAGISYGAEFIGANHCHTPGKSEEL